MDEVVAVVVGRSRVARARRRVRRACGFGEAGGGQAVREQVHAGAKMGREKMRTGRWGGNGGGRPGLVARKGRAVRQSWSQKARM